MSLFDDKLFVKVTLVVLFIIFAYVMVGLVTGQGRYENSYGRIVELILVPLTLIFIILVLKFFMTLIFL